MPSPLLLVQALLNRRIVTAEDETGDTFHNIADVEEGGRPSRPQSRGFLSQFRGRYDTMRSEAAAKGEGPSSSPDRHRDFADEDVLDEEDEDDEILDTEGHTPRSDGTDGVPSPALRGADDTMSSPTLTPTNGPTSGTPRKRTIRHHDEENGGGESSDATRRGDEFSSMKRSDTQGSTSTWSWVPQPRTPGPIRKALRKTKNFIFQTDPTGEKDGNQFIPNYRYMPILSGVLSPFAILLEIPGLTEHWYIRTENHQIVETRRNPPIVMIAMGFSMACGLVANLALIARFLERRVKLNTWLAMIFLAIHDIINIIVVTAFGVIHRFDDGFTYGEAFWMCVCSTIFSLTVTATLAYDLITTPEFAKSGSGLTRKQRSLVIMVMILLCYIALGSLVFAELLGLTFQDGLYYTVVSIETIGFGDITPTNPGSIVFCIFYSTIGIINIGLVVNTTRETIIEAFENAYRKRAAEIARRRHEHKVMRVQQRERRIAMEKELREAGLPLYVRVPVNNNSKHHVGGGRGYMSTNHNTRLVLNEAGLSEWRRKRAEENARQLQDPENTEVVAHDMEVPEQHLDSDAKKGRALVTAMELKTELAMGADDPDKDDGETYAAFRRRIQKEERKEFYTKLTVAWTFFILFWVTGAGIFMATEKEWSFGRSFYFCWMSFSTIGYGEIVPKSPAGRAVFVVWALMGVAAMTILIAVLSEAYSSQYKSALQKGSFHKAIKSFEGKEAQRGKSPDNEKSPRESIHLAHEEAKHEIELENAQSPSDLAQKILDSTRRQLDVIPLNVITHAKTFHDHVRYFANHPQYPHEPPPTSLTDLLDEIAESEKMDERMKEELLGDEEARKALFFMSYERAFRKLIETAERAVEVIAVKDFEWERLVEMLKDREGIPVDTPRYEAPAQQRRPSSAGMTLRQREKSKNDDEEARDEKPSRRSLGASKD
ncbi:hypothetical protein FRC04_010342 [Tulasnella sp. 424]|nr:hypothetical protein FRC04_010342 [Tulasnella sp. 424]